MFKFLGSLILFPFKLAILIMSFGFINPFKKFKPSRLLKEIYYKDKTYHAVTWYLSTKNSGDKKPKVLSKRKLRKILTKADKILRSCGFSLPKKLTIDTPKCFDQLYKHYSDAVKKRQHFSRSGPLSVINIIDLKKLDDSINKIEHKFDSLGGKTIHVGIQFIKSMSTSSLERYILSIEQIHVLRYLAYCHKKIPNSFCESCETAEDVFCYYDRRNDLSLMKCGCCWHQYRVKGKKAFEIYIDLIDKIYLGKIDVGKVAASSAYIEWYNQYMKVHDPYEENDCEEDDFEEDDNNEEVC